MQEQTSTDYQIGIAMTVNFARIAQDEAQLLDQVQNYPEKMTGLTCNMIFQVRASLQGATEEIPDLIIVCAETQQVLTHR